MERLRKIHHQDLEITYVDYSHCKEREMIALTQRHKELVLRERKMSYFIANYENTYGSPDYMKAAKEFTGATRHLITKGAFLGIRGPKVYLLKGITFLFQVNFKSFEGELDALAWLTTDVRELARR
jgi:hypothetical protein